MTLDAGRDRAPPRSRPTAGRRSSRRELGEAVRLGGQGRPDPRRRRARERRGRGLRGHLRSSSTRIGRRDAADALRRLERLFSGRDIRVGNARRWTTDDNWPVSFSGCSTTEVRRMLLIRAALEPACRGGTPSMPTAELRGPDRAAATRGAGRAVRHGRRSQRAGQVPYLWYKVAQRAARYRRRELARALARAARRRRRAEDLHRRRSTR